MIVGLASRAPLTFFDEPYLGLDAVARQLFYDRLLSDYAEHPRTVVLSTHLIDEVSNLLEHVLVIDDGRILDRQRRRRPARLGDHRRRHRERRRRLHRRPRGAAPRAARRPRLGHRRRHSTRPDRRAAADAGLELTPVSLQQLIVRSTTIGEDLS